MNIYIESLMEKSKTQDLSNVEKIILKEYEQGIEPLAEDAAKELQKIRTEAQLYRLEQEERKRFYNEAKNRVEKLGYLFGDFQAKFRCASTLPDMMTYDDAMTMVLEALNWQGVVAWNGDATGIVAQLIMAQYERRKTEERS